jgi:hypothetical protein
MARRPTCSGARRPVSTVTLKPVDPDELKQLLANVEKQR